MGRVFKLPVVTKVVQTMRRFAIIGIYRSKNRIAFLPCVFAVRFRHAFLPCVFALHFRHAFSPCVFTLRFRLAFSPCVFAMHFRHCKLNLTTFFSVARHRHRQRGGIDDGRRVLHLRRWRTGQLRTLQLLPFPGANLIKTFFFFVNDLPGLIVVGKAGGPPH
jgi:hypothetical protein